MNGVQISEKPCLLFIHGYGSSKDSNKFKNLKDYFKDRFDYAYMDWVPESDFLKVLNAAYYKIKNYKNVIIIGDSTGANLAYQLRRIFKAFTKKQAILVLTSPLLDPEYRLRKGETPFIDNLQNALREIYYPDNCLIIATKDYIFDQPWLYESDFENVKLIGISDQHQLLKSDKYLWIIKKYIESFL